MLYYYLINICSVLLLSISWIKLQSVVHPPRDLFSSLKQTLIVAKQLPGLSLILLISYYVLENDELKQYFYAFVPH